MNIVSFLPTSTELYKIPTHPHRIPMAHTVVQYGIAVTTVAFRIKISVKIINRWRSKRSTNRPPAGPPIKAPSPV